MADDKPLPYDAEVEYLESTGTQWIDTGVLSLPTTRIDLDFMPQNTGVRLFGSDDLRGGTNRRFWVAVGGNGTNLQYNASANNGTNILISNGGASILGVRTAIVATGKSFTAFGLTRTDSSWTLATDNGCSIGLFVGHRILADGSEVFFAPATMRLYSCAIYDGLTIVRNFIPVRIGTEGAMYDRVTDELYRNRGTGAFVIGPDKSAANGGGTKRKCVRRSHRRSLRPSARFWRPHLWKEVA